MGFTNDKDEAIAQAKNVVVGEMAKLLAADDPQAIANAVMELSRLEKDKLIEMGEKGRAYVLHKHTYGSLAKQLLIEIEK